MGVSGDSAIFGKGACNELSSHSYMCPRIAVAGHVFGHSLGGLAALAKSRQNQDYLFHLRVDGVARMAPTRAAGSTPRSGNGSTRF